MTICFACIALNARPWLAWWLREHYSLADQIVIVEGADRRWPAGECSPEGLSLDGTGRLVQDWPDPERKIEYVPAGWQDDKAALRDLYAQRCRCELLAVPDADELFVAAAWPHVLRLVQAAPAACGFMLPICHLWAPPGSASPASRPGWFITGSYADVPHCRLWRAVPGLRYTTCHNVPTVDGVPALQLGAVRVDLDPAAVAGFHGGLQPAILHYGFCCQDRVAGRAKNAYYLARGEASTRPATTAFRAAWLAGRVPAGAVLHPYPGPYPAAFRGRCPEDVPCALG